MVENFETLREVIDEIISEKRDLIRRNDGHIVSLQDENEGIAREIKGLEIALSAIGKKTTKATPSNNGQTLPTLGKYANMSLTEAVENVIHTYGAPPGLSIPQVIEILTREGFQSDAKDLYQTIYTTAMRLCEKDRVSEGKKDGKRTFVKP